MLKTSPPILLRNFRLAVLAGASVFLAFETFRLVPFILFFPVFFNALIFSVSSSPKAFFWGFFVSFIIMLGGFYWVTYVIHEFGYLPWSVSALLFLGFCGFGALNFPVFAAAFFWLNETLKAKELTHSQRALWFAIGIPALFTLIEWSVPKLFPWYLGHSLYQQSWLIQLCEITGSTFFSFLIYCCGSVLGLYLLPGHFPGKTPKWIGLIPASLVVGSIFFSLFTLNNFSTTPAKTLRVALIQANIGSLDKVAAEQGISSRVDSVLNRYKSLTEQTLAARPQLIVWPETAIPFQMDTLGHRQESVRSFVKEIGVPLLAGAYATSPLHAYRDYNAAFYLEPGPADLRTEIYYKNILLAFGEYLPLGDLFPRLYAAFPQVSDFERGTDQRAFTMADGTRLGVSICYEAIVPSFMRKVAEQKIHAFINLTNDSWFGPTSEPYLHGALSVFRAIEHRVPLIRVTNTGTSFTVDALGRLSRRTPVYDSATLVSEVPIRPETQLTFYGRWGDWFIGFLLLIFSLNIVFVRGKRASLLV